MVEIEIPQLPEDIFKGSDRALQLKKIRKDIRNGIFAIGVLSSIFLLIYAGAQLNPFYIPLDILICVMIIVIIAIGCASLIFKIIDLKSVSTMSAKFFMIRKFKKRLLPIFLTCIILGVILILPQTALQIEKYLTKERTETILSNTSVNRVFWTKDNFGVFTVKSITMNLTSGKTIVVTIKKFDTHFATIVPPTVVTSDIPKKFVIPSTNYHNFTVIFYNPTNVSTCVFYSLEIEISRIFFVEIPTVLLIYSAITGCWSLYLLSAKWKYREESIFE